MAKRKPTEQAMKDLVVFGQAVRAGRTQAGLTLDAISKEVGVSVSHLSEIERGKKNAIA